MATAKSPTVRKRELAARLRGYRAASGLNLQQVGERLELSPTTISRYETAGRGLNLPVLSMLCDLYGVGPEDRAGLLTLFRDGRQEGWWQEYDLETPAYVGLEAAASEIKDYESAIVPGLLQTPEYASAVVRAVRPDLTMDQVEQTVTARLRRQERLSQPDAPEFWAILDEAVLHRPVGGSVAMRAQLERIVKNAKEPKITIQVIPYRAGAHAGLNSTFALLDFNEPNVSSVIFVEGLIGYLYLEKPEELKRYRKAFNQLRAVAMSPDESVRLISAISREEFGS